MLEVPTGNISYYKDSSLRPIAKVEFTDSPYGVDSLGYVVKYYKDAGGSGEYTFNDSDLEYAGRDNILSYDWEFGVPPGITTGFFFKAQYYGYFYAKYTGEYTFYLSKHPSNRAKLLFAPDNSYTPTGLSASEILIDNWLGANADETVSESKILTEGNWYAWRLDYANVDRKTYLSLRYREPDGVQNTSGDQSDYDVLAVYHIEPVEHRKVLSAGITNYDESWADGSSASFLTRKTILSPIALDGSHDFDKSSVYRFVVPIVDGNDNDTTGFIFSRENGLYYESGSGVYLRQGRRINIYLGYQTKCLYADGSCTYGGTGSANIQQNYCSLCENLGNIKCPANAPETTDWVHRFDGVITEISVKRELTGTTIDVTCQDYILNAIDGINENFPNSISYAQNDFITSTTQNEPNGETRPMAYDSWPIANAARDLLIKAKIDPTKLYERKTIIDRDGNSTRAEYLIDDYGIILKRKPIYGGGLVVENPELEKDDSYIWKSDFGTPIYEMINKMADLYGFLFRCNTDGNIEFRPINAPKISVVDESWFQEENIHSWVIEKDIRADGGKYAKSNHGQMGRSDCIKASLYGAKFDINYIREAVEYISGWDVLYDEYPKEYPIDRSTIIPFASFTIYKDYSAFSTSLYVIRPQRTFTGTDIEIPLFGVIPDNPKINDGECVFDIYIGPYNNAATGEGRFDLVSTGVSIEGNVFPILHGGYLDDSLTFSFPSNYTITSGATYGVKIITRDTEPLNVPSVGNWTATISPEQVRTPRGSSILCNSAFMSKLHGTGDPITSSLWSDQNSEYMYWTDLKILGTPSLVGGESQQSLFTVEVCDSSDVLITSFNVENYYVGSTNHSNGLLYPADGLDFTGKSPCVAEIPSYMLSPHDDDGMIYSYGQYNIYIYHNSAFGATRITSIGAYSSDISSPVWLFDTYENITSLSVDDGLQDIRNDIIVIGNLLGKVQTIDGQIFNENNPILDYVYSRATDVGSIYNPNAINSLGRQKPLIILEPGVVDQKHADWLSLALLRRYRTINKIPSWSSFGIPLIDINDPVCVSDIKSHSTHMNELQWVSSCGEKYENGTYTASFSSTPFEPWNSYIPKPQPDISDFDNYPFINIQMTNTLNEYVGSGSVAFDVYEVEESGNRLMVKYDQVIDGFVNIRVMKCGVELPVAYLLGSIENGVTIYEYREYGYDNILYWDCTDETSASRREMYISATDQWTFIDGHKEMQNLYATTGDYYLVFELKPFSSTSMSPKIITTGKTGASNLPYRYNKDGYELVYGEGESPANENILYKQLWTITWGNPVSASFIAERPVVVGNGNVEYENCTYVSNGNWFNIDNSDNGVKVTFTVDSNSPRLLNFDIDAQLIQNVSLMSADLVDTVYDYAKKFCEYYIVMKNDLTYKYYGDIYTRDGIHYEPPPSWIEHIDPLNNRDDRFIYFIHEIFRRTDQIYTRYSHDSYWETIREFTTRATSTQGQQTLSLAFFDQFAKFIEEGSTRKVVFWSNDAMPSRNLVVDVSDPFQKYISNENPIVINFNPRSIAQSNIDLFKLPLDMSDLESDRFKQAMTTMCWLNILNKREYYRINGTNWQNGASYTDTIAVPKIGISVYAQLLMKVYDKTGRFINSDTQKINTGSLTHSHNSIGIYNESPIIAYGTANAQSASIEYGVNWSEDDFFSASHEHPSGLSMIGTSALPKCPIIKYKPIRAGCSYANMFDMEENYGIGLCNSSIFKARGIFTWHGYIKTNRYGFSDFAHNVPIDLDGVDYTDHWVTFDNSDAWPIHPTDYKNQSWWLSLCAGYVSYLNNISIYDPSSPYASALLTEINNRNNELNNYHENGFLDSVLSGFHFHVPKHETMKFYDKTLYWYEQSLRENNGKIRIIYNTYFPNNDREPYPEEIVYTLQQIYFNGEINPTSLLSENSLANVLQPSYEMNFTGAAPIFRNTDIEITPTGWEIPASMEWENNKLPHISGFGDYWGV